MWGKREEPGAATVIFRNELHGKEDVHVYYVKRRLPAWPPRLAPKPDDAVRVGCRFGRRGVQVNPNATNATWQEGGNVSLSNDDLEVHGEFFITVRRDWAPLGATHFLKLVSAGFFDGSCIFRAVTDFLVQFGVSPNADLQRKWGHKSLRDDPPRPSLLPMRRGTLAFAGSGKDSRTSQLFLALGDDVAGRQPWETPVGYIAAKDGLEVLDSISTEYGDLAKFGGRAPDPLLIEKDNGSDYLLQGWPDIDYFESCTVVGQAEEDPPVKQPKEELVDVGVVRPEEQLTHKAQMGDRYVAKVGGPDGQELKSIVVRRSRETVELSLPSEL